MPLWRLNCISPALQVAAIVNQPIGYAVRLMCLPNTLTFIVHLLLLSYSNEKHTRACGCLDEISHIKSKKAGTHDEGKVIAICGWQDLSASVRFSQSPGLHDK